ncbi:hypothetical protein GOP47_0013495 [Adiantum capillus-veneris]|uniref:Trichome birefringence-like N-terminal domain-containing protein n=1 Tax=Adiantum capillus-veneris TaxID=13818 RepID=A0A9D4ZDG1_ADICA|nr:hypothetical protein GOP47_0013495 [Adiantum capillus-veneris]
MESSKLLTQRAVVLILMIMVVLPFVLARLYISHITLLLTAVYTELPLLPLISMAPPLPKISGVANGEEQREQRSPPNEDHIAQKETVLKEEEEEKQHDCHEQTEEDSTEKLKKDEVNTNSDGLRQEQIGIDDPIQVIDFSVGGCNIWKGKWIPHHSPPAYTNATCQFIQGHQDCLKNGRPDLQYLQWKWKPHDCDLPLFDAEEFLKLVQGKAWAFVGDSISRNHFQSILCFLSQVESPEHLYRDDRDLFVRWFFPLYNFTLAVFWSPFLVRWTEDDVEGLPPNTQKLHLDVVDKNWASAIHKYDYVVLSGGHWFMKPSIYFMNNEIIGCHYLPGTNFTQIGFYYGLQTALQTVYDYLISSSYNGVVFFRTFTPAHFENGQWHEGGNCVRTAPTHNATLGGVTLEMYNIQVKEFGRALRLSKPCSTFKIVDTIHASVLRADGHPGPYRSLGATRTDLPQDCLHWCLPGAIDTWSAMLLEMLRHM